MKTRFKVEINLDDEMEVSDFIENYGTTRGQRLANLLGLKGKGSATLASALSNYAWNKKTAMALRLKGDLPTAMSYELICDRIYRSNISPICDCW
jgi:hypothetical protein